MVGLASGSPTDRNSVPLREMLDHQTGPARRAGVSTAQKHPSLNEVCELVDKHPISGTILRCIPHSLSEGPQENGAPASDNKYPPTSAPFISFLLSLSHSPLPPNLPGITSQITYWHRRPSLRARLGGPTLKTGMQISLEREDKKRYCPLRLEIFLAKYYEGKSWREEGHTCALTRKRKLPGTGKVAASRRG